MDMMGGLIYSPLICTPLAIDVLVVVQSLNKLEEGVSKMR